MLKLLSKIFKEKPLVLDTTQDLGMARMEKRRKKTTEMALTIARHEFEHEQNDSRKDILSKARNMEIGTSYKGYSSRARDEKERRTGTLIKDCFERINHLPG